VLPSINKVDYGDNDDYTPPYTFIQVQEATQSQLLAPRVLFILPSREYKRENPRNEVAGG